MKIPGMKGCRNFYRKCCNMRYQEVRKGRFLHRPNRFVAQVELNGKVETVHVKNTGRCRELLPEGAEVYLEHADHPGRRTQWDLIAVKKGKRLINMDSQIPNRVVEEWIDAGHLFPDKTKVQREYSYGESRIDLYVETPEKRILIEVKGVTLEESGRVLFPDAPSQRAIKHMKELQRAVKEGYEAYLFFVVQMKGVEYLIPNVETHPEFARTLLESKEAGVRILAYDCEVTKDSIFLRQEVPVIETVSLLYDMAEPVADWYEAHKRDLPWRRKPEPYGVWVSEIMLQQTRVEAVKRYYERFMEELPSVASLAKAEEDTLLKLWEGLGYYNRVRNMQTAARTIMEDHGGSFPSSYEEIRKLKGIGTYTAGAISAFAYGIAKPAVDGNVLRVITRYLAMEEDIGNPGVKKKIEQLLEDVIPKGRASAFGQGLIEIGALVCLPVGTPKCADCPLQEQCLGRKRDLLDRLPLKKKEKKRRVEEKTVFLFREEDRVAIQKREGKGLLAGLYEFPNALGHLTQEEALEYCKARGLMPVRIRRLPEARHIFSHVEWEMIGYEVLVDDLEKTNTEGFLFVNRKHIAKEYAIPSAFDAYTRYAGIK